MVSDMGPFTGSDDAVGSKWIIFHIQTLIIIGFYVI